MYALTLLVAAIGMVAAAPSTEFSARQVASVASVDRYTGSGCTGTICNKAGSGDLHAGCNAIVDQCQGSVHLNYANLGCKVTAWKDAQCKDKSNFVEIKNAECYQLGPPIKGISVVC